MNHDRVIDLNADVGEGMSTDDDLLQLVTSASICCGAHAGSAESSQHALEAAARYGVVVGAHPGYEDREHFGRRELELPDGEIRGLIVRQFEWLDVIASEVGVTIRHVKPHGALYNQAQRDERVALAVAKSISAINASGSPEPGLALFGLPRSVMERVASEAGLPFVGEGFADRRYGADGRLVPRSEASAILQDPHEIEEQALRLVEEGVQTICLHGDDPQAVRRAEWLREVFAKAGVRVRAGWLAGES